MDNLLRRQPVVLPRYVMDEKEDVAVSGECLLPDYCPDVAVVLKCMMTPYVQNRQWSGEKLLIDGIVCARVLYLDESRHCPREVEFSMPLSCVMHSRGKGMSAPAELILTPKYVHCRAIGPRRLEARGTIEITAKAEEAYKAELPLAATGEGLHTRMRQVDVASPAEMAEKIVTISETMEFSDTLPPAEMLLGGECRAVVRECKVLAGKAIVKGQIYVHQLYAADMDQGDCRCLDFVLPFSQIMDVDGLQEGMSCRVTAQILSDTQRCAVGANGENTALDITVKLLVQIQAYQHESISVLEDAYHTAYPITPMREEMCFSASGGTRWEKSVLPMKEALPSGQLSHILDVWIEMKEKDAVCGNGVVTIKGRWCVCVLARDIDGQVVYYEYPEEYCLEFGSDGNACSVDVLVAELHYRVIDDQLELQVEVCAAITPCQKTTCSVIQDLQLRTEEPYPTNTANLVLYYAQAGEKVWDIGSCCHTSPESICAENGLESDVVTQSSVMLIPV